MRVLSDFDGVLTDITHEAARVTNLFLDGLRAAAGSLGEHAVTELAHSAYAEMAANPSRHGWKVKGRITAFSNEDGFIRVNGLAACLERRASRGDPVAHPVMSALQGSGISGFPALAQKSYEQMAAETAAGQIKPLDPESAEVLKALLARGDEVVVVSNSGTDRVAQLLRGAGIEPSADDAGGPGRVRIRGGARKFLLSDAPRHIDAGDYRIPTDRPQYEKILLEENPDIVVGDVFSLDLALPLELARRKTPGFAPRLFMRRRPYTPAWSADYAAATSGAEIRIAVIDRMEDML
jgi:FMN phosphatase YigB (HAD superfamily)